MHYSISLSQQSRSESWRAVCPLMLSTLITGCVQMVWIIGPRSLPVQLQDRSRSRLIFVIKFAVAYHLWVDGEACPDGFCTSRWSCDGDITITLVCGTLTSRSAMLFFLHDHARIQNKPIICHNAIARLRFMSSFNLSSLEIALWIN